jgi:hypothetical protein
VSKLLPSSLHNCPNRFAIKLRLSGGPAYSSCVDFSYQGFVSRNAPAIVVNTHVVVDAFDEVVFALAQTAKSSYGGIEELLAAGRKRATTRRTQTPPLSPQPRQEETVLPIP